MTSALQLLYILRSPSSRRSQEPIAVLEIDDPNPDPDARRSRLDRRRGRRGEDGDHSRRSHSGFSKGRHPKSCGSHVEREPASSTSHNGSSYGYLPGNSSNGGVSNSMLTLLGLTRNNQLPGAAEEARRRLLERLRTISLTDNRQRSLLTDESAAGDGFDVNNANILNREPTISIKEKIPALCWADFCRMKGEFFRSS